MRSMWFRLGAVVLSTVVVLTAGCGDDDESGSSRREQVLRGRYLVTAVGGCADCHSSGRDPNDPMWLAGYTTGTPGQPFMIGSFKVYPANLTPDSNTGLGKWTATQIFNALRTGKDDEGHYLCPPMPWPVFRNMTDNDLNGVVAYLQSLKPVHNEVPASEGPNPFPDGHGDWSSAYQGLNPLPAYPASSEGAPAQSTTLSQVQHGRYLVTAVGGCADCHSSGKDPSDPLWLAGYTTGTPGQPFMIGSFKVYPANLTPDPDTGLGHWSMQDIVTALKTGKDPDGHYLCPPMPWPVYRNMTDEDRSDIAAYLRSLKPVHNAVPVSEGPNPFPDGHGDWSSAYQNLKPLPAYPAANELPVS